MNFNYTITFKYSSSSQYAYTDSNRSVGTNLSQSSRSIKHVVMSTEGKVHVRQVTPKCGRGVNEEIETCPLFSKDLPAGGMTPILSGSNLSSDTPDNHASKSHINMFSAVPQSSILSSHRQADL